jgi:hypothetical protein
MIYGGRRGAGRRIDGRGVVVVICRRWTSRCGGGGARKRIGLRIGPHDIRPVIYVDMSRKWARAIDFCRGCDGVDGSQNEGQLAAMLPLVASVYSQHYVGA